MCRQVSFPLATILSIDTKLIINPSSTLLGSFMENHDNARFPSLTSDMSLVKNAMAFTMLADGIPIIYEGQEQHYSGGGTPNEREAIWLSNYDTGAPLYAHVGLLNQIRNHAISQDSGYLLYKAFPIYSDDTTIAMRKGDTGFQIIGVFNNLGADGASKFSLCYPPRSFSAAIRAGLFQIGIFAKIRVKHSLYV